jgi:hypothetical protein
MGILDEAIRDHLELKRQRGAARDELKRLEDEAFGPPSRPGEPDFPQAEPAVAEAEQAAFGTEPPTTVVGDEETQGPAEPAPGVEGEPALNGGAEPAAEEHPVLSDEAASPATPFDHTAEDDLDIADLELGLDEPAEGAAAAPPTEPAAQPTPAPAEEPPEPPIESLETVEHPFEPGLSDEELESEEPEPENPEDEPSGGEETETASHEAEPESSDDDVLADTPEFLRDAPEDDELWFEQGEPKDFDFD